MLVDYADRIGIASSAECYNRIMFSVESAAPLNRSDRLSQRVYVYGTPQRPLCRISEQRDGLVSMSQNLERYHIPELDYGATIRLYRFTAMHWPSLSPLTAVTAL